MNNKWRIEYDNDEFNECFDEWWNVTDNNAIFRCNSEEDAEWLQYTLNGAAELKSQRDALVSQLNDQLNDCIMEDSSALLKEVE